RFGRGATGGSGSRPGMDSVGISILAAEWPNTSSAAVGAVKMLSCSSGGLTSNVGVMVEKTGAGAGGGVKTGGGGGRGVGGGAAAGAGAGAGAGCGVAGAVTTFWQWGQRTCLPAYCTWTARSWPQWAQRKFTVCMMSSAGSFLCRQPSPVDRADRLRRPPLVPRVAHDGQHGHPPPPQLL